MNKINKQFLTKEELKTFQRLNNAVTRDPHTINKMALNDFAEDIYTLYHLRRNTHQINLETGEIFEVQQQ